MAHHVEHVLNLARGVVAAQFRERPEHVGQKHGGKTGHQKQRNPPSIDTGEQRNPEYEKHQAVEAGIGLAQSLFESINLGMSPRGVDHQKPEERSKPEYEDRGVET